MTKKLTAWLLSLVLLLSCVPTALAAERSGSFYLTASVSDRTLIEPMAVSYQPGQTIMEALQGSGYTFETAGAFIVRIADAVGNFTVYYDGGGYDLTQPASSITAICFSESTAGYPDGLTELVVLMGRYREMTDNVQRYAPAREAYQAALSALRGSLDARAHLSALQQAIDDYHTLLSGPRYTLAVTAWQNGQTLAAPTITLTDSYGNVSTARGNSIQAVAGTYHFSVSDGGCNRTAGQVTITADGAALELELPYGQWFGEVKLLNDDKAAHSWEPDGSNAADYYIPDTVGPYDLYLYAQMGAVPSETATRLRSIYIGRDNLDKSQVTRSWDSTSTALSQLLRRGLDERSFVLEAQYDYDKTRGYTQIQSYTLTIHRIPTLSALTVTAEGTRLPLVLEPDTLTYDIVTVSDSLEIAATAYSDGCHINGTGTVSVSGDTMEHTVTVTGDNGQSRSYTLRITRRQAVDVTVAAPAGSSAAVYNAAGAEIAPVDGVYHLIPGESYRCVATAREHYHSAQSFVAAAGLTVTPAEPELLEGISAVALYNNRSGSNRTAFTALSPLSQDSHSLCYQVPDANTMAYIQATAPEGYRVTASYRAQTALAETNGQAVELPVEQTVGADNSATALTSCLASCGWSQQVTLRAEKTLDGVTWYQDYEMQLYRLPQLKSLSLSDGASTLQLYDKDGQQVKFYRGTTDYVVTADRGLTTLYLSGAFTNESQTSPVGGGYFALIGGERCDALEDIAVTLDPALDQEDITIQVYHQDPHALTAAYHITVTKTDPVAVTFRTSPADATVFLTEQQSGRRVSGDGGVFLLVPGSSYNYTVTKHGYVGQSGSYTAPETAAELNITLEQAAENANLKQLSSAWPAFRADSRNNGVVSAATPADSSQAMLSWATKLGDGYSADACGCPILVDGYLYVYAQSFLYKVDVVSGQVVATGQMDHSSSFAINTPTYADGMIFVGLSDGTIQAFNAVDLSPLWIYHDPLGGQPNCSIVYHKGYIYTGFWNGEMLDGSYVCLSVTDEQPGTANEEKLATWRYTSVGGFYWAGAYVNDDAVVIGTDDGQPGYTTGYARLLSLDPLDGTLQSSLTMPYPGDLRSSVTWENGYCYFTSKGGYFYRATLEGDQLGGLRAMKLNNYANDAANPAMSTSSPTVYNGRAYVGVSGTGQFKAYSGHNITVIDLNSWSIAYQVRTQGYPQTSALLSTAYEKDTGCVNVYFFDNYTPGKLRMLRDKPGQTAPLLTQPESYSSGGQTTTYDTAPVLFTPQGSQAQYAICSPITDESGAIYFKNDSAYLMCLSSTMERLELVSLPDKTEYRPGETFDPSGMQVIAHYSNGYQRDVTAYVTWETGPLTAEDADFHIVFPYAMYQDRDGRPGQDCEKPFAVLELTITGGDLPGDLNGDGQVDILDAALLVQHCNGLRQLPEDRLSLADLNGDGELDILDAALLVRYCNGLIDELPHP